MPAERDGDVLDVHQDVEEQIAPGGDDRAPAAVGKLAQLIDEPRRCGRGVRDGQVVAEAVEVPADPHGAGEHAGRAGGQRGHRHVGGDVPYPPARA